METVLLVVHLLVAIFLVSVILMQRSSGGALDGLGGGSGANSILSARGTGNFLTRLTAILATIFLSPAFRCRCCTRAANLKPPLFWKVLPPSKVFPTFLPLRSRQNSEND